MSDQPVRGAEYVHDDGTVEVVVAWEDDRVLTVREYPDMTTFRTALAEAIARGTNEDVADLSVEDFRTEE